MDTSVIIVCAGNSTRMNGVNKILLPLGNCKVIGNTMKAFQECESVKEIIIVARKQDIPEIKEEADKLGISKLVNCVEGGNTRQQSVINGIRSISKDTKMVAIHDGARPSYPSEFG